MSKKRMLSKDKKRQVLCRVCQVKTNHSILHKIDHLEEWDIDDPYYGSVGGVGIHHWFETLKCDGCDAICLKIDSWFTEGDSDDVVTKIFPDPTIKKKQLSELNFLPAILSPIYKESVSSFNEGNFTLSSIGVRVSVEAICIDKKVKGRGLKEKIDNLAEVGFLSKSQAKLLHLTRFMGNMAAHEIIRPTKEELTVVIDILESIIKNAYILPKKAELIKQKSK